MATRTTEMLPKAGDTYFCEICGMDITVEADCQSETGDIRLECCGQSMSNG